MLVVKGIENEFSYFSAVYQLVGANCLDIIGHIIFLLTSEKAEESQKKMKKEITQNRSLNDLCTSTMHYELISASVHNRCLKNVSETSRVKTR